MLQNLIGVCGITDFDVRTPKLWTRILGQLGSRYSSKNEISTQAGFSIRALF
jgi:hypothetical protein